MSIEDFQVKKLKSVENETTANYWEHKKMYIIDSAKRDLEQLLQYSGADDVNPASVKYEVSRISRLLSIEGRGDESSKMKYYSYGDERFSQNIKEVADGIEPNQNNLENDREFIKNRNTYILDETKNDLGVLYARFTKAPHIAHWEAETDIEVVKFEVKRIIDELQLVTSSDESKDLTITFEALNKCYEASDDEETKKYILEAIHSF